MTSQLPPTLRRRAPFRSQLAIIMMARLIEPMSITQLFPYINSMCEHLLPGTPKSNIGRYSGAAESAFAIGSFCFMYQWGKLSDRIGRKPTILWGLSGVGASAIAFGLSTNYYMALVSRLLGGALCGNASVIRAALGDITPPEAESWVFSLYGAMWDFAVIIGPVFGAALSDPVRQYPNSWLASTKFLQKFPFFLPCGVIGALALIMAIVVALFFEESMDVHRERQEIMTEVPTEESSLLSRPDNGNRDVSKPLSIKELVAYPAVRQSLLAFFLMGFVSLGFDALFVLFCYSPVRLLGIHIAPKSIAQSFTLRGVFSILASILIIPALQRRYGAMALYTWLNPVWMICYALPWGMNELAKRGDDWVVDGALKKMWWFMVPLILVYTLADLAWAPLSMITNKAPPNKSSLGAMNGMALSCSSLGRATAPTIGGFLYSFGAKRQLPVVWVLFFLIALAMTVQGHSLRSAVLEQQAAILSSEEDKQERGQGSSNYGFNGNSKSAQAPTFQVVLATTPEEREACLDVRKEVFIDEQGYDLADEIDQYDEPEAALHFLLYAQNDNAKAAQGDKGIPAGTIRYAKKPHKLGRLAVSKSHRGFGLGKVLVNTLHEYIQNGQPGVLDNQANQARTGSVITVELESQIHAIKFYERCGYKAQGEEYIVDGQPHQLMLQDIEVR